MWDIWMNVFNAITVYDGTGKRAQGVIKQLPNEQEVNCFNYVMGLHKKEEIHCWVILYLLIVITEAKKKGFLYTLCHFLIPLSFIHTSCIANDYLKTKTYTK